MVSEPRNLNPGKQGSTRVVFRACASLHTVCCTMTESPASTGSLPSAARHPGSVSKGHPKDEVKWKAGLILAAERNAQDPVEIRRVKDVINDGHKYIKVKPNYHSKEPGACEVIDESLEVSGYASARLPSYMFRHRADVASAAQGTARTRSYKEGVTTILEMHRAFMERRKNSKKEEAEKGAEAEEGAAAEEKAEPEKGAAAEEKAEPEKGAAAEEKAEAEEGAAAEEKAEPEKGAAAEEKAEPVLQTGTSETSSGFIKEKSEQAVPGKTAKKEAVHPTVPDSQMTFYLAKKNGETEKGAAAKEKAEPVLQTGTSDPSETSSGFIKEKSKQAAPADTSDTSDTSLSSATSASNSQANEANDAAGTLASLAAPDGGNLQDKDATGCADALGKQTCARAEKYVHTIGSLQTAVQAIQDVIVVTQVSQRCHSVVVVTVLSLSQLSDLHRVAEARGCQQGQAYGRTQHGQAESCRDGRH